MIIQTIGLANARRCVMAGLLGLLLAACGGGGGSGSSPPPPPVTNTIKGQVVDAFVAGASVSAYRVNADGSQGALIAGPATTDSSGNYSLNLGTYAGPVLVTSTGGTYVDTASGQTVDLSGTGLVLSAIVPSASGSVTAEITPMTTMAAQLVPSLIAGGTGTTVSAAATSANSLVSNYFGISNIVDTVLLDLSQAGCTTGASQGSIDASLVLAAIGQLAATNGVSAPSLTQALIADISDGKWDGKQNGTVLTVTTTTGSTIALSAIEGHALSELASAVSAFVSSQSDTCKAAASSLLLTALTNTGIFTTPAAPTGVAAAAGNTQLTVTWSPVTGASSYNLYLATATGVRETPTGLPGYAVHLGVTSPYVLTGLTNGTTYYVVVTAVDGVATLGSESVESAEVSATPTAGTGVSLVLTPATAQTVAAGGTLSFMATVSGSSNTGVTWSLSPASGCGSLTQAGVYTAPEAAATCTVTATSAASASATASVVVTVTTAAVTLQSISLTPPSATITSGTTQQFTATGLYSNQTTQNLTTQVTWSSSQVSTATISNATGTNGLATAVAAGSTTITAALGAVSAQAQLTVSAPAPSESLLYSFAGTLVGSGGAGNDAGGPQSPLIQGSDGNFYGVAGGGAFTEGTVFRITPAGAETVLWSFSDNSDAASGPIDGGGPVALIQYSDGNFYGLTHAGGANGQGTFFRVTPAGVETVLYSFGAGADGVGPNGGLILASDGNFYGTTDGGGTSGYGTVFRITAAGTESVVYSFTAAGGSHPVAGLIQGSDGNFYGTTTGTGLITASKGTVFSLTPAGVLTVLHTFAGGTTDGSDPAAGLIQASDGNFYGTTSLGGLNNTGTVFRVTAAGAETLLHSFTGGSGDGSSPYAPLVQASDGNLYGVTYAGGSAGDGTAFRITTAGAETLIHSFTGGTADAINPYAGLIQASDGNLYGTSEAGGAHNDGTAFRLTL